MSKYLNCGRRYFDLAMPTYLENWTSALRRLSIAQTDIPLSREEAILLGASIVEIGFLFEDYLNDLGPNAALRITSNINAIRERLDEAIRRYPNGAFVRLGSRSPKDSWHGRRKNFHMFSGEDAIRTLIDGSDRITEDLLLALANTYCPHIFVRQWVDIQPWQEFRCFMKGRKLVGISQYHYIGNEYFVGQPDSIRWAIEHFFKDFKAASHLDDVVFDVIVKKSQSKHHYFLTEWEVKLLEINPFNETTDPTLFDWNKPGDLDGTFRFIDCDGQERKISN